MKTISVLVAEDHETVRQGVRVLLESQPDIQVIGEAVNGTDALVHCRSLSPDVVILDVSMPGMNGLAAARAIKEARPRTAIVAFTRHDDDVFVHELMTAGASGYVLKQSRSIELLNAVRAVATGSQYLDGFLKKRAAAAAAAAAATDVPDNPRQTSITEREKEVLRMMAIGHTNKAIASDLNISVKTVEVHKANAMRKL